MIDRPVLARGVAFPHVAVRTTDGETFTYQDIWQRRNLFLVSVRDTEDGRAYEASVRHMRDAFRERETTVVVTHDSVPGLPQPGLVVADRWGAIVFVAHGEDGAALPPPQEALDWIHWVQCRC